MIFEYILLFNISSLKSAASIDFTKSLTFLTKLIHKIINYILIFEKNIYIFIYIYIHEFLKKN